MKALFQLGAVVITQGAKRLMEELGLEPSHYLTRRVTGDWGDLDEQDRQANETALLRGERILSAYMLGRGKIYIITESDRSATTILRPDEY